MQEILPKIACLPPFFLFKFLTVLLESCMKIALITAGNGAIKQLDPDLLAICWYMGETKDFYGLCLVVYNKHPKFSKNYIFFLVPHFFLCYIF